MKRNVLLTALIAVIYYVVREITGKKKKAAPAPRRNHLTTAFSKAKAHAVNS
jgi:hypothetical protein